MTQRIHIQKLSPKNKEGLPYIPLRQGFRNRVCSLSHTWSRVISLAIFTSGVSWHFPGLALGATWYFSNPVILFVCLFVYFCTHCLSLSPSLSLIVYPSPPPSCHIPHFDSQTHFWERHLDLEVYISTATLHEQLSSRHIHLSFDIQVFSQTRPPQVFWMPWGRQMEFLAITVHTSKYIDTGVWGL
jgi:hypothetical protein